MSKVNLANNTQVFIDSLPSPAALDLSKVIPRITAISGPNRTAEDIDISAFDSPGSEREYLSGRVDPGEISITVQYSRAHTVHATLEGYNAGSAVGTPQTHDFVIRSLVDSAAGANGYMTKSFKASVSGFEFTGDLDAPQEATITLKVTGSTTVLFPDTRIPA